ncbi:hypothetical protein OEZ86_001729 [Tetradesmus obliquus]|nr:hypothetical protein OEZ86_001729 [Tetradesmus obliquus]
MVVLDLLDVLQPVLGDAEDARFTRRGLFISQLTRKHPVPFFQFLDISARSEQLDPIAARQLVTLVMHGCTKIGTKGLLELLSSPVAAAALGSVLCSIVKLEMVHDAQCPSSPSAAAVEPESRLSPYGVANCLFSVATALKAAAKHAADEAATLASGSSSREQAKASMAILAVLLCKTGTAAVSQLSRLWKQSAHAKLLQRPPADRLGAKQAAVFEQTNDAVVDLGLCVDALHLLQSQARAEYADEFLQAVLATRPLATLARLLVWLQQRPELLLLPGNEAQEHVIYRTVWMAVGQELGALLELLDCSSNAKLKPQAAEELLQAG